MPRRRHPRRRPPHDLRPHDSRPHDPRRHVRGRVRRFALRRRSTAPPIDAVRAVVRDLAERYPEHPAFCRPEIGRFGRGRWVPVAAAERERRCPRDGGRARSCGPRRCALPSDPAARRRPAPRVLGRPAPCASRGACTSWVTARSSRCCRTSSTPRSPAHRCPTSARTRRRCRSHARSSTSSAVIRAALSRRCANRRPRPTPPSAAVVDLGRHYDAFGRTATAETMQSLRAWRDTHEPDVSMGNVMAAAIRRAFDDAGVKFVSPGLRMLVNGRRYLPPGTPVEGNFATAIYVEPDDPRSPRAVDDVIRRNLDIGRPLATPGRVEHQELRRAAVAHANSRRIPRDAHDLEPRGTTRARRAAVAPVLRVPRRRRTGARRPHRAAGPGRRLPQRERHVRAGRRRPGRGGGSHRTADA